MSDKEIVYPIVLYKKSNKQKDKKKIDVRKWYVVDDCLDNKNSWKDEDVMKIFMNGRHYIIFTTFQKQ
jgi:hypothetical protein